MLIKTVMFLQNVMKVPEPFMCVCVWGGGSRMLIMIAPGVFPTPVAYVMVIHTPQHSSAQLVCNKCYSINNT